MNNTIGIAGAGVMGRNLAFNFSKKGIKVVLYEPLENFYEDARVHLDSINPDNISLVRQSDEFVNSLKSPRIILLLVKAGPTVDALIEDLSPYMDREDVLVDMGNSYFRDTERRQDQLSSKGFKYVGAGISGGHEGALTGASIMPGGPANLKDNLLPVLQTAAARLSNNAPCCEWVGKGAAGHFVKMVHNGIEYGIMQLIAETWWTMTEIFRLKQEKVKDIFTTWNKTNLNSYLLEITARIVMEKEHDHYMLDLISEKASHKGTGKWCVETARELSVPFNICESALDFRLLSNMERIDRGSLGSRNSHEFSWNGNWEKVLREAYYLGVLTAYYQGFLLILKASKDYKMDIDLPLVIRIWQGGCIIRSDILKEFDTEQMEDFIRRKFREHYPPLKELVGLLIMNDLPAPGFNAVIGYLLSLVQRPLPTRLIQAQRDYFGAHGFERTDKSGDFFTKDWS